MPNDRQRYQYLKTPEPIYVETAAEARYWAKYFEELTAFGYDTETTGLDPIRTRIKFFGLADAETRICAPVRLLEHFRGALENPASRKRMSNAKVDMHWTANHGILIRGPIDDTQAADFLHDENRRGRHGLKEVARDHLRLRMRSFKTVFGDVGKTDHEVETLCRIHDILEARSDEDATDVLVFLGQADGDPDVLSALRKLYLSKKAGYALGARKLLKMARDFGLASRTTGTKGFVVDFLRFVDAPDLDIPTKEREDWMDLLEEEHLLRDAHDILAVELRRLVKVDRDPLELLRLTVCDYASLDPWASNALIEDFYEGDLRKYVMYSTGKGKARTDYTLWDFFQREAGPFTRVLWNMERRGFSIDLVKAENLERPLRTQIGLLDRKITGIARYEMNPGSATELRDYFFRYDEASGKWTDYAGEPVVVWTTGGASGVKLPSTNKKVLEIFDGRGHPLAGAILEYRALTKLQNTYVENMPAWVDHRGRVHTTLKQGGAVTNRLSSADPNLQNIPVKTDLGKKIRDMFIAGLWGDCDPMCCMDSLVNVPVPDLPPDFPMTLIVADYKQLEMRVMAHFSEDEQMIKGILDGLDLHCWTGHLAQEVLKRAGVAKFEFTYEDLFAAKEKEERGEHLTERDKALLAIRSAMKAVGFGLIYGIGPAKLGRQLGLPITEAVNRANGRLMYKCPQAETMIAGYFAAYSGVKQFIDETRADCRRYLEVRTYLGRPRRLPDILSDDRGVAAQADRQAVNSIIQGTAADIVNEAMGLCEADPELRRAGARMLLQVHDELIFEVPKDDRYLIPAKKRIKALMEDPFNMRVPIQVSLGQGNSWAEAK